MSRRLPPFGKRFQPAPGSGVRVAIGEGAWGFAKTHQHPIMVLPEGAKPSNFEWPSDGNPALIYELGSLDDDELHAMAEALIVAGASSVVAIREGQLRDGDPRAFFDPEVKYVSG